MVTEGHAMLDVLQAAYAAEAGLLGVADFPPLRRSLADLRASDSLFYGVAENSTLLGVVEVSLLEIPELAALAVTPSHFRQGIGTCLVRHSKHQHGPRLRVHTGAGNHPALALYDAQGFDLIEQYQSPEGIAMVALAC